VVERAVVEDVEVAELQEVSQAAGARAGEARAVMRAAVSVGI